MLKRVGYIELGKDFNFDAKHQNDKKYIQALVEIFKKIWLSINLSHLIYYLKKNLN